MTNESDRPSAEQWEATLAAGAIELEVNKSVVASVQGERSVLLDYERGEYYGLNAVATSIWKLLREKRSFADIIDAVTSEYDVSAEAARADVAALLSDLRKRGVIRTSERTP